MDMKQIYICSDTVKGIFSAIYDAWRASREPDACGIALKGMVEQELFCEYVQVEETEKKALAVERMIRKNLGVLAYEDIYYAMMSEDMNKADAILKTIMEARCIPDSRRIMEHLSNPNVGKVFELSRTVENEAHTFIEFVRFRELENGVLYAKIEPTNHILTSIAPHFADRLPIENWMIQDETHQEFVVHEAGKQWVLVSGEEIAEDMASRFSEKEYEYERLWDAFFHTIAIESRKNPKCQMTHLPLKYRKNLVEVV